MSEPKVFGDGDVTICLNPEGMGLCVGQTKIRFVSGVKFESTLVDGKHSTVLEVDFLRSDDKEVSLLIEEQIRSVRNFSWIRVQQR